MPHHTPYCTLEQYIDFVLRMSGSAFTVSVVEEEHGTSPKSSVIKKVTKVSSHYDFYTGACSHPDRHVWSCSRHACYSRACSCHVC
ncbi:Exodeoxyribonuclease 7 small subunit [Labeo rohita]|uniref:Exodeoxyribonuclease 7 small subunit n=1 Tax=Labeo rohita TaxID=84645 RepID=A0ABQ8MTC8_LABRO|nr:Exodeoxyribonuclease 7 small subunit [Labeo rohita]